MGKKKPTKQTDPRVRTFFFISFPTLAIISLAMLFPVDVKVATIMIILAIYQFIMLKQFIDQYHEVL